MNNPVTTREEIILTCKEIVRENGLEDLSIRAVAQKNKISVGAVYNYFPSKGQLVAATIGSIWTEIFHSSPVSFAPTDFRQCLVDVFISVKKGQERYPNFFTAHALVMTFEEKELGSAKMTTFWAHIKKGMLDALAADEKIRPDLFDATLTPNQLADYVFDLFLYGIKNPGNAEAIVKMVEKLVYRE